MGYHDPHYAGKICVIRLARGGTSLVTWFDDLTDEQALTDLEHAGRTFIKGHLGLVVSFSASPLFRFFTMATATAKPARAAAPPAPAASPKPAGIRKLGALGAIASAPAEKKGKDYPLFPGDDDTTALVDQLLDNLEQLEALEGAAEIAKGELIARGLPHWFAVHHGKAEIASSVAFQGASGREILVTAQNRYKAVTDEAGLVAAIGDEAAARYFRQKFELKIDGDKIPETAADALINELQELFARHNASAALTAKATICPNAEFHTARHKEFTPGC